MFRPMLLQVLLSLVDTAAIALLSLYFFNFAAYDADWKRFLSQSLLDLLGLAVLRAVYFIVANAIVSASKEDAPFGENNNAAAKDMMSMQSPLLQAEKVVEVSGEMSGGGNMSLIEVVLARKEKKKDKEDKIKRLSRKTEENKKRWHVKSPVFCYASVFVCASKAICRLVLDDPTGPVESEKSVAVFWGAFAATLLFTFLQRYVFGLAVRQAVDLARLKRREQSSRRKGGSLSSAQGQEEIKVQAEDDEQSDSTIDTWRVLKEIGSLCAPDWRLLAMAFVALSIGSAGTAAIPYVLGKVVNAIASSKDAGKEDGWILKLVGVTIVTGVFTGLRGSLFILAASRFAVRLRKLLFKSIMEKDISFFDKNKTGQISSRLSADCQKVTDQVQLNVNVLLRSVFQCIFTLGFMLLLNWRLALCTFVTTPLIAYCCRLFGNYMQALSKETQAALADSNSIAEECFASMRTVNSHFGQKECRLRFSIELGIYYKVLRKQAFVWFFYSSSVLTIIPFLTQALVLYYGGKLFAEDQAGHGGFSSDKLISFYFYLTSLLDSFTSIFSIYSGVVQAVGASEKVFGWIRDSRRLSVRLRSLTSEQEALRVPCDFPSHSMQTAGGRALEAEVGLAAGAARGGPPDPFLGEVEFRDVCFSYPSRPDKQVLLSFSLRAAPGKVVALCGESGGGKSSVMALVERFYEPHSGSILLDGRGLASLPAAWLHQQVALVSQEPTLYARTIRENILFGFFAFTSQEEEEEGTNLVLRTLPSDEDMIEAARRANAHEFIMALPEQYDTDVGERGTQLSGGQKQRIAIARALVRRPRVLLLDEATSALDAESEHIVQQAIDSMISGGNMTVIMIAHRLSTIKNADVIAVVQAGRIVEIGAHAELLEENGKYAALVRRQMQQNPN